jgi:D-threo-aldose 1-dehydrogenase
MTYAEGDGRSRLGVGTAPFGNVFGEVGEAEVESIVSHALASGIRIFDTAPLYGNGLAERRLGRALRDHVDDAEHPFRLSTKVGRTLDDSGRGWHHAFSRDAILRGVEDSLSRLGMHRVETLLLHDPDDHLEIAQSEAFDALLELKEAGVCDRIGVGTNTVAVALSMVRSCDLDVVLIAGRLTLLDTSAAIELLPACQERNVAVRVGGVFNSGVLANPEAGAWFDYRSADAHIVERARALAASVAPIPLATAALAFAAGHPGVSETLVGVASLAELAHALDAMRRVNEVNAEVARSEPGLVWWLA